MSKRQPVLSPSDARVFYDRFGSKQDHQGFYEDVALDEMLNHAGFEQCRQVFEFGCGTGKMALHLLTDYLPGSASYRGCDISPVMIDLASQRLQSYQDKVELVLTQGEIVFQYPENTFDHVVSSYVLDLLTEQNIAEFFDESFRVLKPGGRLCLVSLTPGVNLLSKIISDLWTAVFRFRSSLVGGCRPITLSNFISSELWNIVYRRNITPYAICSEVVILSSKKTAA